MDKIAVLIPCYNEESSIEKVITDMKQALPGAVIYVYDNNSTDKTASIAESTGAIVRYEHRQGKGNVIRRMLQEVDAECYLLIDGDDTYNAADAIKLVAPILSDKADMTVGDRLSGAYYTENKRRFHNVGNALVKRIINSIYKANIEDIMTGYRAFSYNFAKTFPVLSNGFEVETEMSMHMLDKNLRIINVPIDYKDRCGSKSKLRTIPDGAKVLKTISRLFRVYKPFRYFSTLAGLLTMVSTGFFVPILIEFFQTKEVLKFPTLIVCCLCYTLAMILFVAGIVLETIRVSERGNFEFRWNTISLMREKM